MLTNIKTIPAEVKEWFAELPEGERLGILKVHPFDTKLVDFLDLPAVYNEASAIDILRLELFPTERDGVEILLALTGTLDRRGTEWFARLLQPYIQPAFQATLAEPERMTIPNVNLFATTGMKAPEGYTALVMLTDRLYAESVLLLSPAQIVEAFGGYNAWKFSFSSDNRGDIRDLLQDRLEGVKEEVKAVFTTDEIAKTVFRRMLMPDESPYMAACVRTFLEFLVDS